jgi:hypothetical protein
VGLGQTLSDSHFLVGGRDNCQSWLIHCWLSQHEWSLRSKGTSLCNWGREMVWIPLLITRVGQNRIYTPYVTVYSAIFLPKILCTHRFWPTLLITQARGDIFLRKAWLSGKGSTIFLSLVGGAWWGIQTGILALAEHTNGHPRFGRAYKQASSLWQSIQTGILALAEHANGHPRFGGAYKRASSLWWGVAGGRVYKQADASKQLLPWQGKCSRQASGHPPLWGTPALPNEPPTWVRVWSH